ncbi:MAG: hypothetical protein Q9157_007382 [Trypethelium eluteriae]
MGTNHLGNHKNPIKALLGASATEFKTFFQWFVDVRNLQRLTSLTSNWKRLRAYYNRLFSKPIDQDLGDNVLNFIQKDLRSRHHLDTTKRPKPILNVDDLVGILLRHWKFDPSTYCDERQRVQVALLLLIAAYTGSRPSSILNTDEIQDKDGETKAVCYRHIELYLVKSETLIERLKVVALLTLPYGKGDEWKPQPKTFLFYENPNLLLCPVALILALAFHDNAFVAEGVKTRKLLEAQIPHRKLSI